MGTKLKNSRRIFKITMLFVIIIMSVVFVDRYPNMAYRANEKVGSVYENSEVIEVISKKNYNLLKQVEERRKQKELTPEQVFFSQDEESTIVPETDYISGLFEMWEGKMNDGQLHYLVIDNLNQTSDTNTGNRLDYLLDEKSPLSEQNKLLDLYGFYVVENYDSNGNMQIEKVYGADAVIVEGELKKNTLNHLLKELQYYFGDIGPVNFTESKPADVTIIYGIPKDMPVVNTMSFLLIYPYYQAYAEAGVLTIIALLMISVAAIALLAGGKKLWYKENGSIAKIPFEINVIALLFILYIGLNEFAIKNIMYTENGKFNKGLTNIGFPESIAGYLVFWMDVLMWFLLIGGIFIIAGSLKQFFVMGPIRYLKERSCTGAIINKIANSIRKVFSSFIKVDLMDKTNRAIIRVIILNFVVLALLCSVWIFGIFGLLLYSIILFFLLKKYMSDLKYKYCLLLNGMKEMAAGDLDIKIKEHLGVLEPLKEKLEEVQVGFRKAVDEEVKSQKMRTELITNVSHDLKTPLTAIITYVDLLKNENITEGERKSYIETLERKSQRLKVLIEDLFEMSKAESRNVKLSLVEVDIAELIKQTQIELQDRIDERGLDVRWMLPEERILLLLDSQKTFRVFENLMNNTVKYALPGSRVYIEIIKLESKIIISLKNISKDELNVQEEELLNRFVRGDKARNTEGSGLGLSIVKSFVELQGGNFTIVIDGDLFKAIIEFPVYENEKRIILNI